MVSQLRSGAAGFGTDMRSEGPGPARRRELMFEVVVDGHSFDDDLRCRRCGASAWAWVEAGIPCRR